MNNYNERILVVEDDCQIRNFIKYIIEKEGYKLFNACNGESALSIIVSEKIDLIILDLGLPDFDGIKIIEKIREWSEVPIIVVSARDQDKDKVLALDTGADDYITKPFIVDELVARVKAHLRREKRRNSIGNNIIKIGEIEIHKDSYEVYLNKELIDLSTREFQLFLYLCENAGQVLSREQIFNSVWGSDFGDIGTVAVNIKSLRDKIDKENKYIKTIWGVGYKLIKPIGEVI